MPQRHKVLANHSADFKGRRLQIQVDNMIDTYGDTYYWVMVDPSGK